MGQPLIILGEAVAGAARSAVAAGYEAWCIDLRGDRDLREIAAASGPSGAAAVCPADEFPMGMLRMVEEGPRSAPVLLAGPLENHDAFVRAVAFERTILGSGPDAIAAVRDPAMLPSLKPVKGLKFCETRTRASFTHRLSTMIFGAWGRRKYLLKPRASWGGAGIDWWTPSAHVAADQYLQQYIRGQPYTAMFHGDGWSCALLGVVEQMVGEAAFGAAAGSFQGCGYLGPVTLSEQARAALSHLGVQLTQRCDVRGLFSVDLIMDMAGVLWPIEVNPRYPSAAAILERAEGAVTLGGTRGSPGRGPALHGMAPVRARRPATMPDLYELFARGEAADVPAAGRPIRPGQVICTVFARGSKRDEVTARLGEMAAKVYERVEPRDVVADDAAGSQN